MGWFNEQLYSVFLALVLLLGGCLGIFIAPELPVAAHAYAGSAIAAFICAGIALALHFRQAPRQAEEQPEEDHRD